VIDIGDFVIAPVERRFRIQYLRGQVVGTDVTGRRLVQTDDGEREWIIESCLEKSA
jgi:hypothetical protein